MTRLFAGILFALLAVLNGAAQERIVAMDSHGGGILPDSVKLDVVKQRVYGNRVTAEGYNLQRSTGLDAPTLAPKLSPMNNVESPRLNAERYIDSLGLHYPDVAMPSRYAVIGANNDLIWQRNMFAGLCPNPANRASSGYLY